MRSDEKGTMKMIDLYFSIEELQLLEDVLNEAIKIEPYNWSQKDLDIIEDARNQMLEALKSKGKE